MRAVCYLLAALLLLQNAAGYRILGLFPLNGKSHFIVSEPLMRALAERGHQVDVVSHFPLENPPPNYRDISLKGSVPNAMNNFTFDYVSQMRVWLLAIGRFMRTTGTMYCSLLELPQLQKLIKEPPNDPPYDLVIVEVFSQYCYLAFKQHLKVPMVGLVVGSSFDWIDHHVGNPLNTAYVHSMPVYFGRRMNFWQRLVNTVTSIISTRAFNYFLSYQNEYVEKYFGPGLPSVEEMANDLDIVLINSHPSIQEVRPMMPNMVQVGGLHLPDNNNSRTELPEDVAKFLDDSKDGCIYFTFGSMVKIESMPEETLRVIYTAFQDVAPIRVLMKIAVPSELPPGLPPNVMVKRWFPQPAVLLHKNTRAFITHGGLMGSLESIHYGVPMIGIPLFGDQEGNIKQYVEKGIAIHLDVRDLKVETFASAIKTMVNDPSYRENTRRLSKLMNDRPMRPIDTATFWVEYAVRNGGVLKSPELDFYWWQVALLDVYAFLLFCPLLLIYLGKLAICRLFRRKVSDKEPIKLKKNK